MVVHLIDGTYELFRQFYGRRRGGTVDDKPFGAVIGVLHSVLEMIETGATHIGVATDHVIESFRNDLWPGYKTGAGIDPALRAQFEPLELALAAMGVTVWADGRARGRRRARAAARLAAEDDAVEQVCIWTPDKDLAQCVRGDRVVQVDRRANADPRRRAACARSSASSPRQIPDFLALVGDSADGYPGIRGHRQGRRRAAPDPARLDRGLPARGPRRASATWRCCSRISRR